MFASGHRKIYESETHNLGDKDYINVDAYRQFHEDHHVERNFEHLTNEWPRTRRERW